MLLSPSASSFRSSNERHRVRRQSEPVRLRAQPAAQVGARISCRAAGRPTMRSSNPAKRAGHCQRYGASMAGRASPRLAPAPTKPGLRETIAGFRGARTRLMPGAAARRRRGESGAGMNQQSNAARALLEDLHQGMAAIALALGALRRRPLRRPGRGAWHGADCGKDSPLSKAPRSATHFLVFTDAPAGVGDRHERRPRIAGDGDAGSCGAAVLRAHVRKYARHATVDLPPETARRHRTGGASSPAPAAPSVRRSAASSLRWTTPRCASNSASSSANSRRCSTSSPIT